jgi:hypothetical protein
VTKEDSVRTRERTLARRNRLYVAPTFDL